MTASALRHKLVCVLFRKRSDFAAFAREHDGGHGDMVPAVFTRRGLACAALRLDVKEDHPVVIG